MESTTELILKSHFGQLKEDVNNKLLESRDEMDAEIIALLKSTYHYFKKLKKSIFLDEEGVKIYNDLAALMKEIKEIGIEVPEKLPMAKAGNRQVKPVRKNTGS